MSFDFEKPIAEINKRIDGLKEASRIGNIDLSVQLVKI